MRKNNHQTNHPQVKRLNEIVEQKGLTKAEISRICNVSKQAVNAWFARGTIGKPSAIKLSEALGVSLAWVLGQDVALESDLSVTDKQMLHLFRQLPNEDQQDIMQVISLRLKRLDDIYEKYMLRRNKDDNPSNL
ncbi:helix-turn-helix domain-containing protein [Salmonella enterica]|uniref:helix-turn-helix domain-containing protein n=1 Tax=Salmonella enterica TaxID=28901 RepID=UPI000736ADBF|nr:helix-turn-helix domain-containing protein [Salmonella enterica]KTZ12180.1 regulator [Salmonella enterica subsp. enterica serovar Litchfield]